MTIELNNVPENASFNITVGAGLDGYLYSRLTNLDLTRELMAFLPSISCARFVGATSVNELGLYSIEIFTTDGSRDPIPAKLWVIPPFDEPVTVGYELKAEVERFYETRAYDKSLNLQSSNTLYKLNFAAKTLTDRNGDLITVTVYLLKGKRYQIILNTIVGQIGHTGKYDNEASIAHTVAEVHRNYLRK